MMQTGSHAIFSAKRVAFECRDAKGICDLNIEAR